MLYLLSIAGALIAGTIAKLVSDSARTRHQITRNELLVGVAILTFLVVPLTVKAGVEMAKSNNLKYHEYWNGFELDAKKVVDKCERDSGCTYTYSCDPYNHVHVDTHTSTDANGNVSTYTTTDNHTHYHSCPYSTIEWDFYVDTTLGEYKIGKTRIPEDAESYRAKGIPDRIKRGEPKQWVEAKQRLDNGIFGPVTKRMDYDNFILASQDTILKEYSSAIDKYRKAKQLPTLAKDTHHHYLADKVHFVGVTMGSKKDWQHHMMNFNASLGSDLQGDMQMVIFNLNDIADPDEYAGAIYADWQGARHKKDALSKNGIVVFIGTEDMQTVKWASAVTGLPIGNEQMLQEIRHGLRGVTLEPKTIFGYPQPVFKDGDLQRIKLTDGVLEGIVWGPNKFERVCMVCDDEGDTGTGFSYLEEQIELTTGQQVGIFFISLLTSSIVWAILFGIGDYRHAQDRRYT